MSCGVGYDYDDYEGAETGRSSATACGTAKSSGGGLVNNYVECHLRGGSLLAETYIHVTELTGRPHAAAACTTNDDLCALVGIVLLARCQCYEGVVLQFSVNEAHLKYRQSGFVCIYFLTPARK